MNVTCMGYGIYSVMAKCSAWVQVVLAPGMSVKKGAGAVKQALQKDTLRQQGFTWLDMEQYEHEVNVLQRFLVDTSVSGGISLLPCADC